MNIHERIVYTPHLYLLTSHSLLNMSDFLIPTMHLVLHSPGVSTCKDCQAHRHISELLLLGTADRQFFLETTFIMGFGNTVFPCFSFPLELFLWPFPNFSSSAHSIGLGDTRDQRRRLFTPSLLISHFPWLQPLPNYMPMKKNVSLPHQLLDIACIPCSWHLPPTSRPTVHHHCISLSLSLTSTPFIT